ncbi:heterokaryon incompatibility protein-domain-containing protein [Podospora didyma]|uniref:Heterokaryon incompatibility protein-domain-containing protein n=1 Tax=Podospora didyma TaxID=330526 RepID=A0AAE0NGV0_9PEZI|nr:heterokaryon incompatibility protein-domain-containing protein [Podospora didyma]
MGSLCSRECQGPAQPEGPVPKLCSSCDRLDFETMFSLEVKQSPIGLLSDYTDPSCSFCKLISKSISLAWGPGWDAARLSSTTTNPPPHLFIQSRSPLSVNQNGRTTHPQPRLLLAISHQPPSFHLGRAPLREVDRMKDRFIVAEIESLPDRLEEPQACLLPRREVGDRINARQLKRWLRACQEHKHSMEAVNRDDIDDLFQDEYGFRVIDVVDECLVQKTERCEYVALSYVWGRLPTLLRPGDTTGQTPVLLSLQNNIEELSVPRGLSLQRQAERNSGRIPNTVRDAMELTRQIEMRYLWVDTLCIVQDDSADQARQIGRMDDVYNSAAVTVIAAAGDDADAGLSGIRPRQGHPIRPSRIIDGTDGTTLGLSLCLPSLCEEVRRATWNTRGWTFQEQCLSRRCLYFTAEEVFFNCSETQWREGYDYGEEKRYDGLKVQVRTGPPWWSSKLRRDLDPTPYHYLGDVAKGLDIHSYQRAVQAYSRRELTYKLDKLNAFEGICSRFGKSGNSTNLSIRQTQGFPTHLLFQAILWFPSDEAHKSICTANQPEESVDSFSTWSWASWTGPVEFVFAESLWLSRNISQAALKGVPPYVPITCWYFGGSTQRIWSSPGWEAVCGEYSSAGIDKAMAMKEFSHIKGELGRIGMDAGLLLENLQTQAPPRLLTFGELGFFAPYLPAAEFRLSPATGQQVFFLEISEHRGQFRFDGEVKHLDKLVVFVTTNTITKPPDIQSVLMGLSTLDGISTRVGIGYIYYSKEPNAGKLKWQYTFFTLR